MAKQHLLNLFSDHLRTLPILVLYLTDGCNSRCVTCDIWRSPRVNMRRALVEQLLDEAQSLGVRWVTLSGGEAMQHPHWPEIAQRFRQTGARVLLLTNGLLLRKQSAEVIASVDEVVVSLDGGTAPTYAAIRGVDAFDLVLDGIAMVRAGGIPVTTRTTVQQANFRELSQIIDAALAVDVNTVSFLTVDVSNPYAFGPRFTDGSLLPLTDVPHQAVPVGALTRAEVDELAQVLDAVIARYPAAFAAHRIAEAPDKLRRMIAYFRALAGDDTAPTVRCNAPHTSVVIEVDGTLRPCYFLPNGGRITEGTPLTRLLNSPEMRALRHAYRTGQRPECSACVCPLYKGPRSLLKL